MARYRGQDGVFEVGATAIEGECESWSIETEAEIIVEPAMSDEWDPAEVGAKRWSGQMVVFYDPANTTTIALVEGASIAGKWYPAGDVTGRQELSGTALVRSMSIAPARNSLVKATIAFTGQGPLARAAVA